MKRFLLLIAAALVGGSATTEELHPDVLAAIRAGPIVKCAARNTALGWCFSTYIMDGRDVAVGMTFSPTGIVTGWRVLKGPAPAGRQMSSR